MKTKLTSIALLVSMLATLVACGGGSGSTETTTAPTDTTTAESTTNENDPGLPERDFNGYTFTFAVRGIEGDPYQWNNTDIVTDGENGDVLNDSIYERNMYMKDKYNVNIDVLFCGNTGVNTTGSDMYKVINTAVMAGDATFDAILSSPYDSIGYAMTGLVTDLKTLPNLDLSRSYWDQNANKQLTFGNKVFITTGDITYIDNKATHTILFNKQLAEDYNISNPYDAVKDGTWTLDRFIADCKAVARDLDGDGEMTKDDLWGFTYWQDGAFTFITCTGNKFGEIDSNGEPQLTLYSERAVNTWEKMIDFISGEVAFDEVGNKGLFDADQTFNVMFGENHALYGWATVSTIIKLRSSDIDFGILPAPKYDEEQEEYITSPHAYGNTMLTVPVTMSDRLDETGFILEAFAAKSADVVTPAFYDKTLVGKSTRDNESAEILDMIYANKYYDIGYFFQWGDYTNVLMNAWNAKNPNFSSLYEANEAKALEDIEKIAELFE